MNGKTTPSGYYEVVQVLEGITWQKRRHAEQLFAAHYMQEGIALSGTYAEKRALGVLAFRALSPVEQAVWYKRVLALEPQQRTKGRPRAELMPDDDGQGETVPSCKKRKQAGAEEEDADLRAVGLLLTWNGSWADESAEVLCAVREAESLEQQAERLNTCSSLKAVFEQFWAEMCERGRALGFQYASAAMEQSTHAERQSPGVRVHLHAFLNFPTAMRPRRCADLAGRFVFQGKAPSHVQFCRPSNVRGGRERAVFQGHYYLQAPKIGSIYRVTNFLKNQDFAVQGGWIMGLWKTRKMTHEATVNELIESRDRTAAFVQEVHEVQRLEDARSAEQLTKQSLNTMQLRPFKAATPEETTWLEQYTLPARGGARLRRYKLLIYDGPSRTGKSELAVSWFGESRTLVLNCQGVRSPCLHSFNPSKHLAVLFDEASWDLVWSNRQFIAGGGAPCPFRTKPVQRTRVLGEPLGCATNYLFQRLLAGV
jgi:hypothetical protein